MENSIKRLKLALWLSIALLGSLAWSKSSDQFDIGTVHAVWISENSKVYSNYSGATVDSVLLPGAKVVKGNHAEVGVITKTGKFYFWSSSPFRTVEGKAQTKAPQVFFTEHRWTNLSLSHQYQALIDSNGAVFVFGGGSGRSPKVTSQDNCDTLCAIKGDGISIKDVWGATYLYALDTNNRAFYADSGTWVPLPIRTVGQDNWKDVSYHQGDESLLLLDFEGRLYSFSPEIDVNNLSLLDTNPRWESLGEGNLVLESKQGVFYSRKGIEQLPFDSKMLANTSLVLSSGIELDRIILPRSDLGGAIKVDVIKRTEGFGMLKDSLGRMSIWGIHSRWMFQADSIEYFMTPLVGAVGEVISSGDHSSIIKFDDNMLLEWGDQGAVVNQFDYVTQRPYRETISKVGYTLEIDSTTGELWARGANTNQVLKFDSSITSRLASLEKVRDYGVRLVDGDSLHIVTLGIDDSIRIQGQNPAWGISGPMKDTVVGYFKGAKQMASLLGEIWVIDSLDFMHRLTLFKEKSGEEQGLPKGVWETWNEIVKSEYENKKFKKIISGNAHFLALSTEGEIFQWNTFNSKLDTSFRQSIMNYSLEPFKVANGPFNEIDTKYEINAAIGLDSSLWLWGEVENHHFPKRFGFKNSLIPLHVNWKKWKNLTVSTNYITAVNTETDVTWRVGSGMWWTSGGAVFPTLFEGVPHYPNQFIDGNSDEIQIDVNVSPVDYAPKSSLEAFDESLSFKVYNSDGKFKGVFQSLYDPAFQNVERGRYLLVQNGISKAWLQH